MRIWVFLFLWSTAFGEPVAETYHWLNTLSEAFEKARLETPKPVSSKVLLEGAIQGMLQTLDPHSRYLDRRAYGAMMEGMRDKLVGIGVELSLEKGVLTVITPLDHSPAQKAGLLPGDQVIEIEGVATQNLSLFESGDLLKGEVGQPVSLLIARRGGVPFLIKVVRDHIALQCVQVSYKSGIAHVRLAHFNAHKASKDLGEALRALPKACQGIVLDLRNNPGGLLEEALSCAQFFLPQGKTMVTVASRAGEKTYKTQAEGSHTICPLVVLVNGGTASSAEIMAAALQENGRALLLGTQTFGKGTVQTVFPLGEGESAMVLTTAFYKTPQGHTIDGKGIIPDVQMEQKGGLDIQRLHGEDMLRQMP